MTAPITDTCIFAGDRYVLMSTDSGRFISLDQFGMEPRMLSTACYSGFYATYQLNGNALVLARLVLSEKNDNYIPIGGISPKYDDVEHAWIYSGLCEEISYTGKIRLGKWLDGFYSHKSVQNVQVSVGSGDRISPIFSTVLDITLINGAIDKIEDRSEELCKVKQML